MTTLLWQSGPTRAADRSPPPATRAPERQRGGALGAVLLAVPLALAGTGALVLWAGLPLILALPVYAGMGAAVALGLLGLQALFRG